MLQKLNGFSTPSAADFNRLVDAYNRLLGSTATAPLEVSWQGGAMKLRMTSQGFYARVIDARDRGFMSNPRYSYSVAEVVSEIGTGGTWVELDGGRVLDDIVYELNDTPVDEGAVVWVEPFGATDWRFVYCCAGEVEASSSSSSDSDGSGSESTSGSEGNQSIEYLWDVAVSCVDGVITVEKTYRTATWNGSGWEIE